MLRTWTFVIGGVRIGWIENRCGCVEAVLAWRHLLARGTAIASFVRDFNLVAWISMLFVIFFCTRSPVWTICVHRVPHVNIL